MLRLLLALVLAQTILAQPRNLNGSIKNEAGQPLGNVTIEAQPGGKRATSGPDGQYSLSLEPGSYLLTATLRGFVPGQLNVDLGSANVTAAAITLTTVQTSIEVREKADDFLATSSVSVTKSPAQLLDLPYAVQVIPQALFEVRQIQDIKELYRNISGITDGPYSAMTARGFLQREILYNGLRGNPYGSLDADVSDAGFSTTQGRLSNIEFVEVLKGPSAVLFGSGEPGGIMSFVTKKPRTAPSVDASIRTGNFAQKAGHLDLSGPLRKNLFGRAAWFQEDRRMFRNNTGNENQHLASGLSWKAGDATSVGFEFEYVNQYLAGQRLRGVPVTASGGWLANREWTSSEPTDFTGLQARVFQAKLDHAFTPTFRLDATLRYLNSDRPERYHEPRGILADGRTMSREFRDQLRTNNDWNFVVNGYERVNAGKLGRHDLVFGMENVNQDWLVRYGVTRSQTRGGPVPGIDLFNPVYGRSIGVTYPRPESAWIFQTADARRVGFFAQDQIQLLPRLQLQLGGRLERMNDDGTDSGRPLRFRYTAVTGRAGLAYRVRPNVSLFGSYGSSFNRPSPLAQTPRANGPHEPELGRQLEGGVKSEWFAGKVLMNASLFRIVKRNVLRPDPNFGPFGDNESAVLAVGKARSQGFEFDITGRVNANVSIIANYAWLDSKILTDRTNPGAVGRPLPNAARHAAGLFLRYALPKTGTAFSVGGEARGRRYEPYAGILQGGYAIADLGVSQRLHKYVELRAKLDNAFDRFYSTVSLFAARAGNMPGSPRTFTVSLHFTASRER